jgi:hypothetical protein
MADGWTLPEGGELKYQDGDFVRIDITSNPEAAYSLPFLSGYVRGYDALTVDGKTSVAYGLYSVGNHPLNGVREDRLVRAVSPFGIGHGRGAHGDGKACHLCGANL